MLAYVSRFQPIIWYLANTTTIPQTIAPPQETTSGDKKKHLNKRSYVSPRFFEHLSPVLIELPSKKRKAV